MDTTNQVNDAVNNAVQAKTNRRLEVDVQRYQEYLDDPALSETERAQIIKALWTIISGFVELGFDVHPVQQACGKVENSLDGGGFSDSTEVQSQHHKNEENIDVPSP